jgi:hypothetical protein
MNRFNPELVRYVGGPLDGTERYIVAPLDFYYAMKEPDPFLSFQNAPEGAPPTSEAVRRVTYQRIWGTANPIIYRCDDTDRAQEVINLADRLGLKLTGWQQNTIRYWFKTQETTTP